MSKATKTKETFNCLYCNAEKNKMHCEVSKNKFCTPSCRGKFQQITNKFKWLNNETDIIERSTLRKYIAEERGYRCDICEISEWCNKSITLQVDHIDGDAGNHKPNNVRLLCPNCHSQQNNWGARNKGSGRKSRGLPLN